MPEISSPFSSEMYLALCAAIAQGALVVEYGDKKIEYRSLDEMIRIKGIMEQSLGISNDGAGRRLGDFQSGV